MAHAWYDLKAVRMLSKAQTILSVSCVLSFLVSCSPSLRKALPKVASGDPSIAVVTITSASSPYDYGSITVGVPVTQTFTVSNTGTLDVSVMSFTGLSGVFTDAGSGTCGGTLAANATCTYAVTYTPVGIATTTQILAINYTDTNLNAGVYSFTLTGTGTSGPSLSYVGASGTTGTIGVGMSVTPSVFSAGVGASVTSCAIKSGTTALPTGLTVDNTTCVITGTPSVTAALTTYTLTLTDSFAQTVDATVNLTVNGILSIAANTFTTTTVGATNSTTFTVTNTGTGPMTIGAGTPRTLTTGTNYSITGGTCTASLTVAVSGTCTIIVQFAPLSAGTLTDTINLAYNNGAGNQSATRAISAVAITQASLAFNATSYDFGSSITDTATATLTLTVTNSGATTATGMSASAFTRGFEYESGSYPGHAAVGSCGATLAPAATCTIKVRARAGLVSGNNLGKFGEVYTLTYNNGAASTTATTRLIAEGMRLKIATYPYNDSLAMLDFTSSFLALYFGEAILIPSTANYRMVTFINSSSTAFTVTNSNSVVIDAQGTYSANFAAAPTAGGPSVTNNCGFGDAASTVIPAQSSCTQPYYLRIDGAASAGPQQSNFFTVQVTPYVSLNVNYAGTGGASCACNPADSVNFGGGLGSGGNPWQICSRAHLDRIDSQMGSNANWAGKYFQQCGNIDLGGVPIRSIGSASGGSYFEGSYDGRFYQIQNVVQDGCVFVFGTYAYTDVGLFQGLGGAGTIKNLGINGFNGGGCNRALSASTDQYGALVGTLASSANPSIEYVWIAGASIDPLRYVAIGPDPSNIGGSDVIPDVGGLVGQHTSGGIRYSQFHGTVSGGRDIGGLVGSSSGALTIQYSSAHAAVGAGNGGHEVSVGGLVGALRSQTGFLLTSYFHGQVAGGEVGFAGGAVGQIYGSTLSDIGAYGAVSIDDSGFGAGAVGNKFAGGLIGIIRQATSTVTNQRLQFDGTLYGNVVGGLLGGFEEATSSPNSVTFADVETRFSATGDPDGGSYFGGAVAGTVTKSPGVGTSQTNVLFEKIKSYASFSLGEMDGNTGSLFSSFPLADGISNFSANRILAVLDDFSGVKSNGIVGDAAGAGTYAFSETVIGVLNASSGVQNLCGPITTSFSDVTIWQDPSVPVQGRLQTLNGVTMGSTSCKTLNSTEMLNMQNFPLFGPDWFAPGNLWPFPSF